MADIVGGKMTRQTEGAPYRYRAAERRRAHGGLSPAARSVLAMVELRPVRVWTRKALVEATGLADRAVRQAVEECQHAGHAVISSSTGGGGYWLATSAAEVERYQAELMSRIRTIRSKHDALDEVRRVLLDRAREGLPGRQGALV